MTFRDEDVLFLLSALMPAVGDRSAMVRALREDPEIRDAVVSDEKVFLRLIEDPLSVLGVSPTLFFSILLARVASDLARHPFTLERSHGLTMALFDGPQVLALLENREVRDYLTDMLVSFVRINSLSPTVCDFDIDQLVRYSNDIDESRRFPVYKRIADICLFTLGIFAPGETPAVVPIPFLDAAALRAASGTREEYIARGTSFYALASRHREARARQMSDILSTLAEKIALAAKPLSVMSARYLQPFKDSPPP